MSKSETLIEKLEKSDYVKALLEEDHGKNDALRKAVNRVAEDFNHITSVKASMEDEAINLMILELDLETVKKTGTSNNIESLEDQIASCKKKIHSGADMIKRREKTMRDSGVTKTSLQGVIDSVLKG